MRRNVDGRAIRISSTQVTSKESRDRSARECKKTTTKAGRCQLPAAFPVQHLQSTLHSLLDSRYSAPAPRNQRNPHRHLFLDPSLLRSPPRSRDPAAAVSPVRRVRRSRARIPWRRRRRAGRKAAARGSG
jgi:hypothetical protein